MGADADFLIEKTFEDFSDDIEAVTIHYAFSPLGEVPDWDRERVSTFMPPDMPPEHPDDREDLEAMAVRRRSRTLKLPAYIMTREGSTTDHYLLHHYFEYWQSGFRHYSPHYTEEIKTGEATR